MQDFGWTLEDCGLPIMSKHAVMDFQWQQKLLLWLVVVTVVHSCHCSHLQLAKAFR
jgi:hypothetical protein